MTTHFTQSVSCACCAASVDVVRIGSTNAFGSMDLDMRPPPMERDTLNFQIHQCPTCGFCSPDLDVAEDLDIQAVGTPEYEALLQDERFPKLARKFRAFAHLADAANSPAGTCWAALRAAWACDDGSDPYRDAAAICREQALKALGEIHARSEAFTDSRESDEILILDLLRRTGNYQAVNDAVARLRSKPLPEILEQIASFQAQQAERQVVKGFTVADAIGQ